MAINYKSFMSDIKKGAGAIAGTLSPAYKAGVRKMSSDKLAGHIAKGITKSKKVVSASKAAMARNASALKARAATKAPAAAKTAAKGAAKTSAAGLAAVGAAGAYGAYRINKASKAAKKAVNKQVESQMKAGDAQQKLIRSGKMTDKQKKMILKQINTR